MGVLGRLGASSVDLVLCDLPYGTTSCKWDTIIPLDQMWEQIARVLKKNGPAIFTASQPFTSALVMSKIKWFKCEWIWVKNKGSNFAVTKYMPMKEHESVLVFSNGGGKSPYNQIKQPRSAAGQEMVNAIRGGTPGIKATKGARDKEDSTSSWNAGSTTATLDPNLRCPSSVQRFRVQRGLHPTQKPLDLMAYLIKTYSNPGDTVLDFTMGSGTTGVAAKSLGRGFIGVENNAKYFEIAMKRIQDQPKGSNMSSKCKSCGASIFFATREGGSPMPINTEQDRTGNLMVKFDISVHAAHTVVILTERQAKEAQSKPNSKLYKSHFATCKNAAAHRKPKAGPIVAQGGQMTIGEQPSAAAAPTQKIDAVSASAVDLFLECSGSILPATSPYSPNVEGSALGTATHEAIKHTVQGEEYRIEHIAATYDVDGDEVEMLVDFAKQALSAIREPLRNAKCELKVSEGNIRSRQDLVAIEMSPQGPLNITSLDWKSGRVMIPKPGQMLANAVALRRKYGMPSCGYIYVAEIWLRDREIIERRFDSVRLDAFEERLEHEMRYAGKSYSPGGGCGFCRHAVDCETRIKYLHASACMIAEDGITELTPTAIADLWPRKQALERALAEYTKVAKGMLDTLGEVPLSDGSVLQYLDRKTTTIDAQKAWKTMEGYGLDATEINSVLNVKKGALEKIVANKAKAKGQTKKSATGALLDDLREAGAMTVKAGRYVNLKHKI